MTNHFMNMPRIPFSTEGCLGNRCSILLSYGDPRSYLRFNWRSLVKIYRPYFTHIHAISIFFTQEHGENTGKRLSKLEPVLTTIPILYRQLIQFKSRKQLVQQQGGPTMESHEPYSYEDDSQEWVEQPPIHEVPYEEWTVLADLAIAQDQEERRLKAFKEMNRFSGNAISEATSRLQRIRSRIELLSKKETL